MEFLFFILVCLGMCHLWNFSAVFQRPRNLVARIPYIRVPFLCAECSSFWVGIVASLTFTPIHLTFVNAILCGVVSYASWVFFAQPILSINKEEDKY